MGRRVLVLPGDGIGPEVVAAALPVLEGAAALTGVEVELTHDLIHGQAWDAYGTFCRDETVAAAKAADAVLCGAVGGPRWDHAVPEGTPEEKDGLMRLRRELDVHAGIRPAVAWDHLLDRTPYRPDVVRGTDLIVLREMCGGVMFAAPRGRGTGADGRSEASDTARYGETEIERHLRAGFALARRRRGLLTSVDKANVMESGALWRETADRVAAEYPDVEFRHLYADNCAYQLARDPRQFDVIVTDNLFGDILSDQAAAVSGSLGMLASASLATVTPPGTATRPGIYEPVHGSAPDLAGRGTANPIGAMLSVSLLFTFGFGDPATGAAIEQAVMATTAEGVLTPDLGGRATTTEVSDAVLNHLHGAR